MEAVLRELGDVALDCVLADGNGPDGLAAGIGRAGPERCGSRSLSENRGAEVSQWGLKRCSTWNSGLEKLH